MTVARADELLVATKDGLFCPRGGFHIDPSGRVARAILTHAHGDHARAGSEAYLATPETAQLVARRFGDEAPRVQTLAYGEELRLGDAVVSLHPAGHMLGSAQVRVRAGGETWVVSGDYKREPDPSCAPFEPLRCEVFVSEATYALPIFRWDEPAQVVRELAGWWQAEPSLPSVLFCYALGKAQRVLAELARLTDRPVFVHGAIENVCEVYRAAGVRLAGTRPVAETARGKSFAGELVLAPITARGGPWMKRFGTHRSAFVSGSMRIRGQRRRRVLDRGFELSDHADWRSILRTVRETGASRVLTMHGHRDALAQKLREDGLESAALVLSHGLDPEGD